MFPPTAYLIGAQKCATTTLAFLLDQHPRLIVATPKEPAFFTRHWGKGLDWYRACFPEDIEGCTLLDATPGYTAAPLPAPHADHGASLADHDAPQAGVPQRIKAVSPEAKFIYVTRDPVARAYSAYWHRRRQGEEDLPFREAVEAHGIYVRSSDYAGQIGLYLAEFPIDRFLFLAMEEVTGKPVATCRKIFRFLELAPEDFAVSVEDSHKNRSFTYSPLGNIVFRASGSAGGFKKLTNFVKRLVPGPIRNFLTRSLTRSIPKISSEDREYLGDIFRQGNKEFARLTGMNTDNWR